MVVDIDALVDESNVQKHKLLRVRDESSAADHAVRRDQALGLLYVWHSSHCCRDGADRVMPS